MMADATHSRAQPSTATVLRMQVETLALARRWLLITLGGLILALFAAEGYAAWVLGIEDVNPLLVLGGPVVGAPSSSYVVLIAAVWALSVWHQETPSRRLYHWSMPVRRGAHDRMRVLAGVLWLLVGVAAFLVGTVIMAVLTGSGAGTGALPSTLWLNYLTSAATVYLLAVIPALRSEYPLGWVVGIVVGVQILPFFLDWLLQMDAALYTAWMAFLESPIGPERALLGGMIDGAWGEPAWDAWLPSALLWLAIAIGGVYAATWRSPDA